MPVISPSSIAPSTLPFVLLEHRSQLPETPCVYFAINSQDEVQYIGQSTNPRRRWKAHSKSIELALMGDIRIAYAKCMGFSRDLLCELEKELIAWFDPPLNTAWRVPGGSNCDLYRSSIHWRLGDVMADRKMTATKLARLLQVKRATVSEWVKSAVIPNFSDMSDTLHKLCYYLRCTPQDLIDYYVRDEYLDNDEEA
ncbi:MAG: helix-turn-helix domain-containing protein [Myxacorys californica WJT36-NPBG1]|jgi:DNA-binding Xre family transcriptional regulator|nr:helix-turn-helix domain-containing protein [Myxacorys californica WJT36-NPBG1]